MLQKQEIYTDKRPRQEGKINWKGTNPQSHVRSIKHWVITETYYGPQHILRRTCTWRKQWLQFWDLSVVKQSCYIKMSHSTGALAVSEQGLKDKLEDSEMQRVPWKRDHWSHKRYVTTFSPRFWPALGVLVFLSVAVWCVVRGPNGEPLRTSTQAIRRYYPWRLNEILSNGLRMGRLVILAKQRMKAE